MLAGLLFSRTLTLEPLGMVVVSYDDRIQIKDGLELPVVALGNQIFEHSRCVERAKVLCNPSRITALLERLVNGTLEAPVLLVLLQEVRSL